MNDWMSTGVLALGCVVALYFGRRTLGKRASCPLPPGPPGLPWIGNVIGINTDAPWITYAEWAKTYGDFVYSRLFGKDIIIINSEKIAKDLLENRSRNCSDRPQFITNEMCGVGFNTLFMPYGDRWRLHRRFFYQTFRPEAANRFLPCQHRRACHLLRQLFDAPEQFKDHIFEYVSSVILNSTYDYDPTSRKNDLIDMAVKTSSIAVRALRPDTAVIIGAFPWLLRLPSWLPGMSFKREMAAARRLSKRYLEWPFEYALKKSDGSVTSSMVHDALRGLEEKGISREESWMEALKGASGTAFLAASESSNSVLLTFFLMMAVNPLVQEKAQAQIDATVGNDRLPSIDDRPFLPFVDAIFWEILRYNPAAPLSIPHAATDDDVYGGFQIPKGALLLPNLWSMSRDESQFPNSRAFIPERFINDDGSLKPCDVEHIAFGFGRRSCVGRHFADTSLWGVIAKVLATFKILNPLDEDGIEIPVEPRFSNGITVHPLPFGCRIIPRFPGMDAEKLEHLIATSIA